MFHVNNFFCEQENAHFSISEALIAAIEQVGMNIYIERSRHSLPSKMVVLQNCICIYRLA